MKRTQCLLCDSTKLSGILDLGMQPFADTFVEQSKHNNLLPVYNLSCVLCEDCGHVQTETITDPHDRYNLFDYSYTSSNSKTSRNHWQSYAREVLKNKPDIKSVCEVGSNDGYLLGRFTQEGVETVLGIDASKNMANISNSKGINTLNCVFDLDNAKQIVKKQGQFDALVANNVLNHSDNPLSFIEGVCNILKVEGIFVFEFPYWKNTIDSKKIDQVYHEHVSYFTAASVKKCIDKFNLEIINIDVVDYHGGSLRVYAKKIHPDTKACHTKKLRRLIETEEYLFDVTTYKTLQKELGIRKIVFLNRILTYKLNGTPVIGIGAAAKGNTLLNYLNLDKTIVDWVTDTSEYKRNKFTPLSNIPICGDQIVTNYNEVCAVILSWNLSDTIKTKLKTLNPNIHFINFYEEKNEK